MGCTECIGIQRVDTQARESCWVVFYRWTHDPAPNGTRILQVDECLAVSSQRVAGSSRSRILQVYGLFEGAQSVFYRWTEASKKRPRTVARLTIRGQPMPYHLGITYLLIDPHWQPLKSKLRISHPHALLMSRCGGRRRH
jgi:hypothetical protein